MDRQQIETRGDKTENPQINATHASSPVNALIYYFSLPFIYLLSALPFVLLYIVSDFFYFLMFYIISYRKQVVLRNLLKSFPEKTDNDIYIIATNFYHNFCDFFLETIKTITISKKELLKRCKFSPEATELFSKFAAQNKNIIIVMGHIGNWEWACNSFNMQCTQQLYVIYHPITNKYFDGLMSLIRTRNGTKLIAMKDTYKEMLKNKNGLNATVFVADQTPKPDGAYWTTFLNQDTPVFRGPEVIAKRMNLPVIYASVRQVKRGYYEMSADVLTEDPTNTTDEELLEMFTKRLEKDIQNQPETWLWSHRRWKHARSNIYQLAR